MADLDEALALSPADQAAQDEAKRRLQAQATRLRPPGPPVPGQPAPPPQHIESPEADYTPQQPTPAETARGVSLGLIGRPVQQLSQYSPRAGLPATNAEYHPVRGPNDNLADIIEAGGSVPSGAARPYPEENAAARPPAGVPRVSTPTAGLGVEADPQWRQNWDRARAIDSQNPMIQALGGPSYGHPGAIPSFWEAARNMPGYLTGQFKPEDYAKLLQAGGNLNVAGVNAMTNRLQVENAGNRERELADTAGRNQYATFLSQHMQQFPDQSASQHHQFARENSGMSTERYQQLTSARPLNPGLVPGSVRTAPAGTQTVNPQGPVSRNSLDEFGLSTQGPGQTATPWSGIERALDRASGYIPPTPASSTTPAAPGGLPKDATVGEFVNNLESTNPGTLAQHLPAVLSYMRNRFKDSKVEAALRAANDPRQLDRGAGAPVMSQITSPLTAYRQMLGGPNDEERGLSVLGNLTRAVRQAGSHAEFLRRQRATQGPTPGSPPLP